LTPEIHWVVRLMTIGALAVNIACRGPTQSTGAGGPPTQAAVGTADAVSSIAASATTAGSAPIANASLSASAKPVAAPAPSSTRWTFDGDQVGVLPSGAQAFSGQWAVRAESDAPSPPNALCQTGNADFPAISLDTKAYTDLTLVTRFKPISGRQDQAGGLIFRVQDKDNYYILRANALENNVIFFIYARGSRSQLKAGDAKVGSGTWHELRVDVRGNAFRGFLDGTSVVDTTDDRYKNGGIGLWTKSDSVTCFDDVEVRLP